MEKVPSIVLLVAMFVACSPGKKTELRNEDSDLVTERGDGLHYFKDEEKPYTGLATGHYPDGQVKLKARLKAGKLHGKRTDYYPNGNKQVSGSYEMGQMVGTWNYYDQQGRLIREANYRLGKKHGNEIYYLPDGSKLGLCLWQDGLRHGPVSYRYAAGGKRMQGQFEKGLKTGRWEWFYPDGKIKAARLFMSDSLILTALYDSLGNDRPGHALPYISGPWQMIVEYPDKHLNDFCLFQGPLFWHAIGIMGTGTWDSETSLFHSRGASLTGMFENLPPLLTQVPDSNDGPSQNLRPQKHAPHVIASDSNTFHMFYRRPWGMIRHMTSDDPMKWPGLGHFVFEQNDARDVCLLRDGGGYLMYYCQSAMAGGVPRSCIMLRRSNDLQLWSEAEIVYADLIEEATHTYMESPFVYRHRGRYYLFMRHRLMDGQLTTVVLSSAQPDSFPTGYYHYEQYFNDVHAAEIVRGDNGRTYMAKVRGPLDGKSYGQVKLAPLAFR